MNTVECPVCKGTGLIGAGDQPHLHLGTLSTCPNCGGTGKIEDAVVEVSNEPIEEPLVEEVPSNSDNTSTEASSEVIAEDPVEVSVDSVETPAVEVGDTLEVAEEVLG